MGIVPEGHSSVHHHRLVKSVVMFQRQYCVKIVLLSLCEMGDHYCSAFQSLLFQKQFLLIDLSAVYHNVHM